MSETAIIKALSNGVNQKGVREHNERLILSVLQRNGQLPAIDIARRTHLSAQTISVILRKLESDGLVTKGQPVKGKVGKPSIPVALNPNGALAIGVKLGRRSCDFFLTNLVGDILYRNRITYSLPRPTDIFGFLRESLEDAARSIGFEQAIKLCGFGIAIPFEIWRWREVGTSDDQFSEWENIDLQAEVHAFTKLPVFVINDATSACWAEHIYGRGKEFEDYAYFFISSFIGGGIVINQNVYEGGRGNAGALGSLRVGNDVGSTRQLVDVASLHLLEKRLLSAGIDPENLWQQPQDWSAFTDHVNDWIDDVADEVAQACLSACAVIDFEAVLIDGAFPDWVRASLVARIRALLPQKDSRGLILPRIEAGQIGGEARAIGAACGPIYAQYFLTSKTRAIE